MTTTPIDLRSDTVTRPSPAMRQAMAEAPVGDDQYGEDPSVNLLQERVAPLLGKEAALFVPSGTMTNQIALKVFTRPGDDVIVGEESHAVYHETGASGAIAGVQFTEVGKGGLFTAAEFEAAFKPAGHLIYPPTTLVEIENTQNRGGGLVWSQEEVMRICAGARARNVASYLDGARLLNAAIATAKTPSELCAPFDLAGLSLSKGLGCPVGSMLAGSKEIIQRAHRYRRMLGGALRQSGILAAAGLYALEHNIARLAEDHANALLIAQRLAGCRNVQLDPAAVRTNIVMLVLGDSGPNAPTVAQRAREKGVLCSAFTPSKLRLVTHMDVSPAQCRQAGDILARILDAKA